MRITVPIAAGAPSEKPCWPWRGQFVFQILPQLVLRCLLQLAAKWCKMTSWMSWFKPMDSAIWFRGHLLIECIKSKKRLWWVHLSNEVLRKQVIKKLCSGLNAVGVLQDSNKLRGNWPQWRLASWLTCCITFHIAPSCIPWRLSSRAGKSRWPSLSRLPKSSGPESSFLQETILGSSWPLLKHTQANNKSWTFMNIYQNILKCHITEMLLTARSVARVLDPHPKVQEQMTCRTWLSFFTSCSPRRDEMWCFLDKKRIEDLNMVLLTNVNDTCMRLRSNLFVLETSCF